MAGTTIYCRAAMLLFPFLLKVCHISHLSFGQHVFYCNDRVVEQHSRSAESHDFFNLLPAHFLIAVGRAICTKGFVFTIPATVQTHHRVLKELPARGAEFMAPGAPAVPVIFLAIQLYHRDNDMFFPPYAAFLDTRVHYDTLPPEK